MARLVREAPLSAVLSVTRPPLRASRSLVESPQLGKRRPERTHVHVSHLRISLSAVLSGDRSSRAEAASDNE